MGSSPPNPLVETLARHLAPAELVEPIPGRPGWVHCFACGHHCRVPPSQDGICRVRHNRDGTLLAPRGYVAALQSDPIEKKPFFHVLPGSQALSFGMLGCDYHCAYCQNWITSQALRDPAAIAPIREVEAGALVNLALSTGARTIVSTYNEPLITSEWAKEVFSAAKERGLLTGYVSNGNATQEVLRYLEPCLDLYKVDLKGFRQEHYRELGGVLDRVKETITWLAASRIWLEVVTLLVPGFNDSDAELGDIAGFLASLSPDIPWHVTAFHKDYRMTDPENTSAAGLARGLAIGRAAGLRFVYAGNRPGEIPGGEDTRCPGCGAVLVERSGFTVLSRRLDRSACPGCRQPIPGIWTPPGLAARAQGAAAGSPA